jgi:hypothetical protein
LKHLRHQVTNGFGSLALLVGQREVHLTGREFMNNKVLGIAMAATVLAMGMLCGDALARGGGGGHGSGAHSSSGRSGSDHYVHGYTRSDGTYVSGYHATNPNSTKFDNYSTKGNINTWTGKPGTKSPDGSTTDSYYSGSYYGAPLGASTQPGTPILLTPQARASFSSVTPFSGAVGERYQPYWNVDVVH